MNEKICSDCGATVLVGLQYCPGCLRPVRTQDDAAPAVTATVAPDAHGTPLERLQFVGHDFLSWLTSNPAQTVERDDPRAAYSKSGPSVTMSDSYTRVVCPKCLRPHRAPLDQSPTDRLMCHVCLHQFSGSMAAEFRRGADLSCFHCGVTTFCVDGLKVRQCPNCKTGVNRRRDPELAKITAFAGIVAALILAGFANAVVTQTVPQFLVWLCIGTVFTACAFVTMVALGL